jgi:DNA-directed RNA polymerase specialized sigma24 family protein
MRGGRVVQEVFLYAYLEADSFDRARGSEKTWITQIALSRALDRKSYLAKRGNYAGGGLGWLDEIPGKIDLERESAPDDSMLLFRGTGTERNQRAIQGAA